MTTQETEVGAAFDAGRQQIEKFNVAEHVVLIAHPSGDGETTIEKYDLEEYQEAPRRIEVTRSIRDVASFIEYVKRFSGEGTTLYAKPDGTLIAVLDDHMPDGTAGWGKHRATLHREMTRAWQAWRAIDDKWLSQGDFGEFLEERIEEIASPPGADLFELVQHFHAEKKITLRSKRKLSNGETQLEYVELIEGGNGPAGTLMIPEIIQISVKPYYDSPTPGRERTDDDPPVDLVADLRLRWRLGNGGELAFKVLFPDDLIERLRQIEEAVIREVAAQTGRPVFRIT